MATFVCCGLLPGFCQGQPELKRMNPQFIPEQGCPVEVLATRTDLEIDGFGAPIAARTYIDYRNASNRPIAAVKFRIGYIDEAGKIRGMFHAPDSQTLTPGGQAAQKWRGEKVDPRTSAIKIRVLIVKFVDGTLWESEKLKEVATPQSQGFAPLVPESMAQPSGSPLAPGTAVATPSSATATAGADAGDLEMPGRGEPVQAAPASPDRQPQQDRSHASSVPQNAGRRRSSPPAPLVDPSLNPVEAFDALLKTGAASSSSASSAPSSSSSSASSAATQYSSRSSAQQAVDPVAAFDALMNQSGGSSSASSPQAPAARRAVETPSSAQAGDGGGSVAEPGSAATSDKPTPAPAAGGPEQAAPRNSSSDEFSPE